MATANDRPGGNRIERRSFLTGLAALGSTAAVVATTAGASKAADLLHAATPATAPSGTPGPNVGKVENIRSEIKEFKDPQTGALVRQLTSNGSDNVHPYFNCLAFVGDGSDHVILTSNRSGSYQWYMLEVSSGKLVQLTDGKDVSSYTGCVARDGRVFYFDGPVLRVVKTDTLEDRELYRTPAGFHPGLPSCTADGHYITFVYRQEFPASTHTGLIYDTMAEEYYQAAMSVIMRVDAAKGGGMAVWGDHKWYNHSLIHPTRPNVILFCHEGGTFSPQRMWIVDLDQKYTRQAVPLYPQKPGEVCVHEYFTQQGEIGFQYTLLTGEQPEEFNAFIRPDGMWIRQYRYPGKRPGHIQSNSDNSVVVGDCAYLSREDTDGGSYLGLMTHVNGEVKVKRLAWHGSSWHTQESHPHPSFSPDDRWVIYNSDADQHHNVYMVDTKSIG